MKLLKWLLPFFLVGSLFLVSCSAPPQASTDGESEYSDLAYLDGSATVILTVNGKDVQIELDGESAPITAGNFASLVDRGFYNGLSFHRVVRDPEPFVVQGGDPLSKNPEVPVSSLGTGGVVDEAGNRLYIPLEILAEGASEPTYGQTLGDSAPHLKHERGAVAMARSNLPNSASSQFYIALADLSFLDGNYAVFGYVTKGMDVVDQIRRGDRIDAAVIAAGKENLKTSRTEGS